MAHYIIRVARHAGLVALFLIAAAAGILSGVLFAYAGDLPQVSALDNYAPSTITRVLAANGQLIGEFATERRVVIQATIPMPRSEGTIQGASQSKIRVPAAYINRPIARTPQTRTILSCTNARRRSAEIPFSNAARLEAFMRQEKLTCPGCY